MGSLNYREVTGFFTARIPDSGDADLNPDTVPLTGHVTFHPEYRKPLVFPGEHIVLEPINAIIIDGQLMVEVIQDEDVVLQALHLPVTMDERANQTWSWTMRFHGMTLGQYGDEVSLPDSRFPVEEGEGPLDLSDVAGTWSGGTLITRGAPGPGLTDITADGDVVTFEWDNGRTRGITVPTVRGVGIPDGGDPGQVIVRTSTGTEWADQVPDTGWVECTLESGITQQGGTPPRVRRMGNIVYADWGVSGSGLPSSAKTSVAIIPPGFRPPAYVYGNLVSNTNTATQGLRSEFRPDGKMVFSTSSTVGSYYLLPAGISWFVD